jgi:hypothetical protein
MYELILTVVVTFSQPVLTLDGHGVSMVTNRYEVAVQNFATKELRLGFSGYADLESSLTDTFGANTKIAQESAPQCRRQ